MTTKKTNGGLFGVTGTMAMKYVGMPTAVVLANHIEKNNRSSSFGLMDLLPYALLGGLIGLLLAVVF